MLNVVFLEDETHVYNGSFSRVADNLVSISGVPAIAGGFTVTRVGKNDAWNYAEYSTVYRRTNNVVFFSNDGSVYEEPSEEVKGKITWSDADNEDNIRPTTVTVTLSNGETRETDADANWEYNFSYFPIADKVTVASVTGVPTAYEVTINENNVLAAYTPFDAVKELKVQECNEMQQSVVSAGTNITLSDGTVEHFTLTTQDQASLEGLALLVSQGQEYIPWHTSDQGEHCKYYTNADMALIVAGAVGYVTYHVTYFRDLRIYIRSLSTIGEVESVFYGMQIPEEYQSEVLKDLIQQMTQAPQPEVEPETEEVEDETPTE